MIRLARTAAIAALFVALSVTTATAHEVSFSDVDIVLATASAGVRLSVHRKDAARVLALGSPESLATAGGVARHAGELVAVLGRRLVVEADGRVVPIVWSAVRVRPERRAVELAGRVDWTHAPGHVGVVAHLFPDDALHETFANVYAGPRLARQGILTAAHPSLDVYTAGAAGTWAVFVTFVHAGIHHIFIGPDHILFVIGLLLLGGGAGRILKITSGFTVAHSITLALVTLGILHPPARLIEPLIALSIVYVGLDNLRHRERPGAARRDGRPLVAFCFGLVHGFGFASVLAEFGLPRGALGTSLVAFNVGVELGQVAIVLAALPLLALLRRQWPRVAPRAVAFASWGVVVAGGWWFIERVFSAG